MAWLESVLECVYKRATYDRDMCDRNECDRNEYDLVPDCVTIE